MHRVADMNNKLHDKKYDYIMPRVVTVEYDKLCKETRIRDGKGN